MLSEIQECPKETETTNGTTAMSTNNPPWQFVNWSETLPQQTYSQATVTGVSSSISDNEVSVSVLIGMIELIFCTL